MDRRPARPAPPVPRATAPPARTFGPQGPTLSKNLQRRVVFGLDKAGITKIATDGAHLCLDLVSTVPGTAVSFEYSPESFTGTELDFALDVCNAVNAIWKPTPQHKTIINLPATVEMATPNVRGESRAGAQR